MCVAGITSGTRVSQSDDALPSRSPDRRTRLCREVLNVTPDDVSRLTATGLYVRAWRSRDLPLRFGATATLLENVAPCRDGQDHRNLQGHDLFYLVDRVTGDDDGDGQGRRSVVAAPCGFGRRDLAGAGVRKLDRKTGKTILDGIGSTELLHIFITNRPGEAAAGTTGRPVSGYEARIVGQDMNELPPGTVGRLAVRGPTGCRYLADSRQSNYVRDSGISTGDASSPTSTAASVW